MHLARDLFEQKARSVHRLYRRDDAVGRHRGAGLGGGHDEREQTLNQLLVEMDGFESNDGVTVAATNRPDASTPPFFVQVDSPVGSWCLPDLAGRATILKVHTRKVPLDERVNLELLARGTLVSLALTWRTSSTKRPSSPQRRTRTELRVKTWNWPKIR